jgi:hypothetical protein
MKFRVAKTIGDVDVSRTMLRGKILTTFAKLIKAFGPPIKGRDYKVTAEWDIEFEDGSVVTIYDWKEDTTPEDLYEWHIGGTKNARIELIGQIIRDSI